MGLSGSVDKGSWFGLTLGIICAILACVILVSPVPTIWKIHRGKSTFDYSFVPFFCMNIATATWSIYAYFINDLPVLIPNSLGVLMSGIYSTVYLRNATTVAKLIPLFILYPVFIVVYAVLAGLRIDNEVKSQLFGIIATVIHLIFMFSPFAVMRTVIKTKSVESMPLDMSLAFFMNAVVWTFYGYLVVAELPIIISNGVSSIFTFFQLVCHVVYGDFLHCCCFWKTLPDQPLLEKAETIKEANNTDDSSSKVTKVILS